MDKSSRIYVAGHRGLVGSAIVRHLLAHDFRNLICRTHAELDLTDQNAVRAFFDREQPEIVFLAAARVGGILANSTYPADFIRINLQIQTNVVDESFRHGVQRLLFLGSSCIYPKLAPQPIKEEYLLTGPLEPTNRSYAIAKIAGIELCWSYNRQYGTRYLAAMPANLYGPEDNFDLQTSHVIPALMRKAIEAKANGSSALRVWGTGQPRREFLSSRDLADACCHLMSVEDAALNRFLTPDAPPLFNIGTGSDISIRELAGMIANIVGLQCNLEFDTSMQDGTPQKLLDVSRMQSLGWRAATSLEDGLRFTYEAVRHKLQSSVA